MGRISIYDISVTGRSTSVAFYIRHIIFVIAYRLSQCRRLFVIISIEYVS